MSTVQGHDYSSLPLATYGYLFSLAATPKFAATSSLGLGLCVLEGRDTIRYKYLPHNC